MGKGQIMMGQYFDYELEPVNETLCIDMKSYYASVECVERGLDPLTTMLIVMSNAENGGGLVLASSPMAKKKLGISNVTRQYEVPDHKDLIIVPPRMGLYIKRQVEITDIIRNYVADSDILVYSIDELFVRVQSSKRLFNKTAYEFAVLFKEQILDQTGLYCTIGIGANMLLSKISLDLEAKHNPDMIANWQYADVPNTLWKIDNLTDFWGINTRTEAKLWKMGIRTIKDLAHYDFWLMKSKMGVVGQQLIAHAWGIDRTTMSESYTPKSKSLGNSQVLMKDYTLANEIEIVIREMSEQVASRLRRKNYQTSCVTLSIGSSRHEHLNGFSRQISIPPTNNSKVLYQWCLQLFRKYYNGVAVRHIAINYSKLTGDGFMQLDLFQEPEEQINSNKLEYLLDEIRNKYGYESLVHASSYLDGATAIDRSSLIGGHAGGMDGL